MTAAPVLLLLLLLDRPVYFIYFYLESYIDECFVFRQVAVDILARILFMEYKPAPIKTKRQRDHVTHHMTHVISGSSSGSSRKLCKERKSIKSPILSYNKWEPPPAPCQQPDSPITPRHQNHVTENHAPNAMDGATSVSPSMLVGAGRAVIESEVREIKQMLKSFMTKVHQRDAKDRIAQEWRLVALTLDRLFFFVYLATILISLVAIFPWNEALSTREHLR